MSVFPIVFDKSRGDYFTRCLQAGEPIRGSWQATEALVLAGACQAFAVARCFPQPAGNELEAVGAAIAVYAELCSTLASGEYDDVYGETVIAVVSTVAGRRHVAPIRGFKHARHHP